MPACVTLPLLSYARSGKLRPPVFQRMLEGLSEFDCASDSPVGLSNTSPQEETRTPQLPSRHPATPSKELTSTRQHPEHRADSNLPQDECEQRHAPAQSENSRIFVRSSLGADDPREALTRSGTR